MNGVQEETSFGLSATLQISNTATKTQQNEVLDVINNAMFKVALLANPWISEL